MGEVRELQDYNGKVYNFYEHPVKWLDVWIGEADDDSFWKGFSRIMFLMISGSLAVVGVIILAVVVTQHIPYGGWLVAAAVFWLLYRWARWTFQ